MYSRKPHGQMRPLPLRLENSDFQSLPDEIICGSNEDSDPEQREAKRRRIEEVGNRYLADHVPKIISAGLKGPLPQGWKNPWRRRPLPLSLAPSDERKQSALAWKQRMLAAEKKSKSRMKRADKSISDKMRTDNIITTTVTDTTKDSKREQGAKALPSQKSANEKSVADSFHSSASEMRADSSLQTRNPEGGQWLKSAPALSQPSKSEYAIDSPTPATSRERLLLHRKSPINQDPKSLRSRFSRVEIPSPQNRTSFGPTGGNNAFSRLTTSTTTKTSENIGLGGPSSGGGSTYPRRASDTDMTKDLSQSQQQVKETPTTEATAEIVSGRLNTKGLSRSSINCAKQSTSQKSVSPHHSRTMSSSKQTTVLKRRRDDPNIPLGFKSKPSMIESKTSPQPEDLIGTNEGSVKDSDGGDDRSLSSAALGSLHTLSPSRSLPSFKYRRGHRREIAGDDIQISRQRRTPNDNLVSDPLERLSNNGQSALQSPSVKRISLKMHSPVWTSVTKEASEQSEEEVNDQLQSEILHASPQQNGEKSKPSSRDNADGPEADNVESPDDATTDVDDGLENSLIHPFSTQAALAAAQRSFLEQISSPAKDTELHKAILQEIGNNTQAPDTPAIVSVLKDRIVDKQDDEEPLNTQALMESRITFSTVKKSNGTKRTSFASPPPDAETPKGLLLDLDRDHAGPTARSREPLQKANYTIRTSEKSRLGSGEGKQSVLKKRDNDVSLSVDKHGVTPSRSLLTDIAAVTNSEDVGLSSLDLSNDAADQINDVELGAMVSEIGDFLENWDIEAELKQRKKQ